MSSHLRRPAVALLSTALAASVLGIAPAAHAADGTLTGTVSGSGAPAEDVLVSLYEYDAQDEYWTLTPHYAYTDAAGAYAITAPEGSYRVGFADTTGAHVGEYHVDAADVDTATTISVPSAGPVDADLATAAHVTGHVTGSGGSDVEDVQVTAYRAVPEGDDVYYQWVGYDLTASDGTYDIGGLPGGTYRIEFDDGWFDDTSVYATEFYVDQPTAFTAEDVFVDSADTRAGIDAQLALDSEISGLVTNASGDPLPETSVTAYLLVGATWREVADVATGIDGTYVLDGLPAGTYRVGFVSYEGDYMVEYWNDHGRISNAQDIGVDPSQPAADVNARLIPGEHDAEYTVANTALPTITGVAVVGTTLTASAGSWSPNPTEYYFDWLRDGEFIMGEYGSTYVTTAADIGKKITVLVSAGALPEYDFGHAESAPTAPVAAAAVPPAPVPPAPVPPVPPTVDVPTALATILAGLDVSGKPRVGRTVKVTHMDLLLRTAVTYKFKWFAGTKRIKKANKYKLKLTRAMKGKRISVKVTATAASTSKSVRLKVGRVR